MCKCIKRRVLLQAVFIIYLCTIGLLWTAVFRLQKDSQDDHVISHNAPYEQPREFRSEAAVSTTTRSNTQARSNVIVASYMRGGSSFLGRVFGFHPDSFYIYEPLLPYTIWSFFRDSKKACDVKTCRCVSSNVVISIENLVSTMTACRDFKKVVAVNMTAFYSGAVWQKFEPCVCENGSRCKTPIRRTRIPQHCLTMMETKCSEYKHTVSKILRMSISMYKAVLHNTNDTKVIYLIRDPRATMNSRITTNWYPAKTPTAISNDAKCLCERLLEDYKAGVELTALFPDRFKVVFYEDLMGDLFGKTNKLYKYIGMRGIDKIGMDVFKNISNFGFKSDHSLRDDSTDYASWWRKRMAWKVLKSIDSVCHNVYATLGYRLFENETELRDMSQISFVIPDQNKI